MKFKLYLVVLLVCAVVSCNKNEDNGAAGSGGKYVVSASKIIALTGSNWNNVESQFNRKDGYNYIAAMPGSGQNVKAEVYVSALDDSSKIEGGTMYLNILPSNTIGYVLFSSEPLPQLLAYAMMLNYHRETLGKITGITNSFASYTVNNTGITVAVDTILSKLRSGILEDRLLIEYKIQPRSTTFSLQLVKQTNGRYTFDFSSNW